MKIHEILGEIYDKLSDKSIIEQPFYIYSALSDIVKSDYILNRYVKAYYKILKTKNIIKEYRLMNLLPKFIIVHIYSKVKDSLSKDEYLYLINSTKFIFDRSIDVNYIDETILEDTKEDNLAKARLKNNSKKVKPYEKPIIDYIRRIEIVSTAGNIDISTDGYSKKIITKNNYVIKQDTLYINEGISNINLVLPKGRFEYIHINTLRGDVDLGDIDTDKIEIEASSGDINIETFSHGHNMNVSAKTSIGNISCCFDGYDRLNTQVHKVNGLRNKIYNSATIVGYGKGIIDVLATTENGEVIID